MSLTKVNYIDNSTIITAKNLNDIQDNIIQNAELVKKAAPRNLLDNSDFTNPVNQRGLTTWNTATVTIDRWRMFVDIGIINLVSNGIELDATSKAITFGQRFDDAVSNRMFASGKKYTVAVNYTVEVSGSIISLFQGLKDNAVNIIGDLDKTVGTHTAVFVFTPNGASGDNTYCPFHLFVRSGNKLILHWAALYEGEYTAETLPEYHPKGYGAELLECQRYFYKSKETYIEALGYKPDVSTYSCVYTLPIEMRVLPTISMVELTGYPLPNVIVQGVRTVHFYIVNARWAISGFTASADL